jgi:hypothetical protein
MAATNAPKDPVLRHRRNAPERGEWQAADTSGWQHGDTPAAPDGLMAASVAAWETWMGAWFASFWTPDDLPGLRQLVRIYDQVERGEFQRAGELRLQMDTYGITPKGQQDRRWRPPAESAPAQASKRKPAGNYGHLRSVTDAVEAD